MPIKYRIEFAFFCFVQNAVNRQQPKASPKRTSLKHNLNAICEFKRSSNMSLTTNKSKEEKKRKKEK
ncbi:CLUMA_CG017721, isoform A [Clunio marinus]|uniref:CLUMA_CG017721, isoform A n=1 Tax=Clunio marinus TaxID=568069 RepID=A0A1J1J1C6_9DIPT|nr:CLUMA_CG017721, isoform A [Clunio marinus]